MNPLFYLYAGINQIFFPLRSAIGWKGRAYHEQAAETIPPVSDPQNEIIQHLRSKYAVRFEASLNAVNTLRNYHLLHMFDQVAERFCWTPGDAARIVDVGSKNFYYAASMQAFFKPKQLTGIELDGFHMYRGFYTNASYASFYAAQLPHTTYHVMNFKDYHEPVDGIVWFFPFILKEDVVTWYLPLNQFEPMALFGHAGKILSPGGFLLMVNTGEDEFTPASHLLKQAGFVQQGVDVYTDGLLPKRITPYVSLWLSSAR